MTAFIHAADAVVRTIIEVIVLFPASFVGIFTFPPQIFRTIIVILAGWGSGYFWEKVAKSPHPRIRALQTILVLLTICAVYIDIFVLLPLSHSFKM